MKQIDVDSESDDSVLFDSENMRKRVLTKSCITILEMIL